MTYVMKRLCHISIRIGKGPRLGNMGREALELRIGKCLEESMSYFNKDWEGPRLGKISREALEPRKMP